MQQRKDDTFNTNHQFVNEVAHPDIPRLHRLFPDARFVHIPDDRVRFQANGLLENLVNNHHITMSRMVKKYQDGVCHIGELMAFYQGIGYSLDGFMEVFYETLHFMEQQGVVCLASGLFEKTAVPSVTYVPPKDLAPNLRPSIGTPVQLHDNDLKRLAALVVGYHDNGNLCLQVFRRGATPSQALDVPYGPHAGCWEPIQ